MPWLTLTAQMKAPVCAHAVCHGTRGPVTVADCETPTGVPVFAPRIAGARAGPGHPSDWTAIRLRLPQCSRRRATRATATCASPIARRAKVLATSCSSRTGSRAVSFFRSCHRVKGEVRGDDIGGRLINRGAGHGRVRTRLVQHAADLEQWADSITAVLDDLGSRGAVLLASDAGSGQGAVRSNTSVPHNRAGRAGMLRHPRSAPMVALPKNSALPWSPCWVTG